jgi:ABC-type transport system involved in Fe-S cluster assembly fused permease/ATPase subunit
MNFEIFQSFLRLFTKVNEKKLSFESIFDNKSNTWIFLNIEKYFIYDHNSQTNLCFPKVNILTNFLKCPKLLMIKKNNSFYSIVLSVPFLMIGIAYFAVKKRVTTMDSLY